jgi:hypothetical protein
MSKRAISYLPWVRKLCYIHTRKYYAAIRMTKLQLQAVVWANLRNNIECKKPAAQSSSLHGTVYLKLTTGSRNLRWEQGRDRH